MLETYMISLHVFSLVTGLNPIARNYIVSGCRPVNLQCPLGSLMIVVQASFTPGTNCDIGAQAQLEDNWSVWSSVISRCNGYTEGTCVYNLGMELPQSTLWGEGRVDVKYRCESTVSSYCGGKIDVSSSGYISSPGYPKYYLAGRECVWNLYTQAGQTVQFKILDLSLQKEDCLSILGDGKEILEKCGTVSTTMQFSSSSSIVELRLRTSSGKIVLRRGMLVGYRPVGCTQPSSTPHSRFSTFNHTHIRVTCKDGYIQKSLAATSMIVECRGGEWYPEVVDCVPMALILVEKNLTVIQALQDMPRNKPNRSHRSFAEFGLEIGVTIVVGILLAFCFTVALMVYFKFRNLESLNLQEDELFLKESSSRQAITEDLDRY